MLKHTPSVYIPVEPEDNGIVIPFLLSAFVHVFIVVFIFFTHRVPYIEPPQSIEASIITPAELEAVQARIGANREAMASGEQAGVDTEMADIASEMTATTVEDLNIDIDFDDYVEEIYQKPQRSSTDTPSTSTSTPTDVLGNEQDSPLIKPLDQEADSDSLQPTTMTEKERIYREKMAEFAAQLDAEIQAEQEEDIDKIKLADAKRAALVAEYKEKALNPPAPRESKRIRVDIAPAEQRDSVNASLNEGSTGSGSSFSNDNLGHGASAADSSPQINTADVQAQLKQLIYSRWRPPVGSTGKQVVALVTVNTNTGKVNSVTVTGTDNAALEQSLENAIHAGPLTPVIGTNLGKLRLVLIAK